MTTEKTRVDAPTCTWIEERIDAFLDGDLTRTEREQAEQHLQGCASCRRNLGEWEALLADARRLASPVEPPHDLWPGVAERIGTASPIGTASRFPASPAASGKARSPFRAPRAVWLPLAAAAVVALAVLLPPLLRRTDPGTPPEVAARTSPAPVPSRQLLAALERQQDRLDPADMRSLEGSVASLDRSIGEIRAALAQDPTNRRLHLWLAERYRQETELLQTLELLPTRL